MKAYIHRILFVVFPFAVTFAMAYLIGSFISASWSLPEWTDSLRVMMALLGNVYGYGLYLRLEWEFKQWK